MRRDASSAKFSISPSIYARWPRRSVVCGPFAAFLRSCDNRGMDSSQMISLDDVVLRGDLDPRLGQRDDDLIAQYADIFDALPPIEINQE